MLLRSKPLHIQSNTAKDGDTINIEDTNKLTICISGTASSFAIQFLASLDGVDYAPTLGTADDDNTYNGVSTTSAKGKLYSFEDIDTYKFFKAKLTNVSGGYINVYANAVKIEE